VSWIDALTFDRPRLRPPAALEAIHEVEQQLGCRFPKDFVEFLTVHDGGDVCAKKYAIYSVGENRYPQNTLLAANRHLPPEYPLVNAGFGPNEQFGFRKVDLPAASCAVYRIFHETWELKHLAPSFRELLTALARCESI